MQATAKQAFAFIRAYSDIIGEREARRMRSSRIIEQRGRNASDCEAGICIYPSE